jgi:hypothetical protein
MSTGGKIVVTLGIASSALLAAWLLTGNRKVKTRQYVVKKAVTLKDALKSEKLDGERELEVYYI